MTHGSLFSGIGGFDIAAQWCGWTNIFQCENDPFCRHILKYHFPNTTIYEDIKNTDFTKHRGTIDVISGGFPCQPFSVAGKRKGTEDNRFLWPEMLRAIHEIRPAWVVAENVCGLLTQQRGVVFESVCSDMEAEGYEIQPVIIPACAIDAPHRRGRIWFIAHRADAGAKGVPARENGIFKARSVANAERHDAARCGHGETGCADAKVESQRTITGFGRSVDISRERTAADAAGEGVQRECVQEQEQRRSYGRNSGGDIPNWQDFPTQSPVCNRNDGFPGKLDDITISSWRIQSIKALGNAIVPQLAFEIFKIIDKINRL